MPGNRATLQELSKRLIQQFTELFNNSLRPDNQVLTMSEIREIKDNLQSWRRVLRTIPSAERQLKQMVTKEQAVSSSLQSHTAEGTEFASVLHDLKQWMLTNTEPTSGLSLRDAKYEEFARVAILGALDAPDAQSSGTTTKFRGLTSQSVLQSLYDTINKLPAQAGSELRKLRDAVVKEGGHLLDKASSRHDSIAFGAELL